MFSITSITIHVVAVDNIICEEGPISPSSSSSQRSTIITITVVVDGAVNTRKTDEHNRLGMLSRRHYTHDCLRHIYMYYPMRVLISPCCAAGLQLLCREEQHIYVQPREQIVRQHGSLTSDARSYIPYNEQNTRTTRKICFIIIPHPVTLHEFKTRIWSVV